MKYMAFNDSEILREFGRLMEEKDGLKKVAQVVQPLSEEEKGKLQHFLGELQKMPANGPGMERWMNRLKGQMDPYLKSVHESLAQRYSLWSQGKDASELAQIPLPLSGQGMAQNPAAPAPVAGNPGMPKGADVIEANEKTAEQKAYDVTGKEDIVNTAHPHPAKVCGDELVENLNEQQKADKEVAEKSAKDVLVALYKLAKRLKAEKNDEAYELVKKTFLDISSSLKK
jgi:hypothetical protein